MYYIPLSLMVNLCRGVSGDLASMISDLSSLFVSRNACTAASIGDTSYVRCDVTSNQRRMPGRRKWCILVIGKTLFLIPNAELLERCKIIFLLRLNFIFVLALAPSRSNVLNCQVKFVSFFKKEHNFSTLWTFIVTTQMQRGYSLVAQVKIKYRCVLYLVTFHWSEVQFFLAI